MTSELARSIRDALLGIDKDELIKKVTRAKGGPVYHDSEDFIRARLDNGYILPKRLVDIYGQDMLNQINVAEFKVGDVVVSSGRYSRPKGFAKAFLVVTDAGDLFYENKKGVLKKITETAFLTHWNKGMCVKVESE